MWQFYFSPPSSDEQVFHLATAPSHPLTVKAGHRDRRSGPTASRGRYRTSVDRRRSIVWLAPNCATCRSDARLNTLRGTVVARSIRRRRRGPR
jgi:hypothetical protein